MKKVVIIILVCLGIIAAVSLSASAQVAAGDEMTQEMDSPDSTNISVGKMNIGITDDGEKEKLNIKFEEKDKEYEELPNVRTRFLLFDVGVNSYLSDGSFKVPEPYEQLDDLNYARSVHFNLGIFRQRINLVNHYLNFDYGLGFEFNMYNYNQDFSFVPDVNEVTLVESDTELKKNKLGTTTISIPAMFVLETNPHNKKRSFRLGAGGSAGILIGSKAKQKTEDRLSLRQRDNFNLNRFRYGVNGMIGYSWLNFYVNYAFSPFFEEGEGPDLNAISFGLILRGM